MSKPGSPRPDYFFDKPMTRPALARQASRGSHYRSDFPYRDDDLFQKHSRIQRSKDVAFEP